MTSPLQVWYHLGATISVPVGDLVMNLDLAGSKQNSSEQCSSVVGFVLSGLRESQQEQLLGISAGVITLPGTGRLLDVTHISESSGRAGNSRALRCLL